METAIQLANSATLRAYFLNVRGLHKNGESFPVNLDEVWPLAYAEKGKAVRALKKEWIDNEDFKVFAISGKKPNGGRPESEYRLSISCLEHFIARKVREVFEVYRQVFHQAIDQVEAQLMPTSAELLLQQIKQTAQLAEMFVQSERRLSAVEQQMMEVRQIQQEASAQLSALPISTEPVVDLSTEAKILKLVNTYSRARGIGQQEIWRSVYSELYYRYHISVNNYRRNGNESKLQMLKRHGHLETVFKVASFVLGATA